MALLVKDSRPETLTAKVNSHFVVKLESPSEHQAFNYFLSSGLALKVSNLFGCPRVIINSS
jgi:hypothetical protein